MSFARTTLPAAFAVVIFSAGAAFAQAGGADVPTDAKKQGTMENGSSSTGMSKSEARTGSMSKDGMKKEGSMEKKGTDKM